MKITNKTLREKNKMSENQNEVQNRRKKKKEKRIEATYTQNDRRWISDHSKRPITKNQKDNRLPEEKCPLKQQEEGKEDFQKFQLFLMLHICKFVFPQLLRMIHSNDYIIECNYQSVFGDYLS